MSQIASQMQFLLLQASLRAPQVSLLGLSGFAKISEAQPKVRAVARSLMKSVVCPVFIGRESLLHTLHQFIDQTKSKIGQTVLVSGEAKAAANQQGLRVLQGSCFQPDTTYPDTPLVSNSFINMMGFDAYCLDLLTAEETPWFLRIP